MAIRWLHLSDFHVGKDKYAQRRLFKKIHQHVGEQVKFRGAPHLVFITGDLANSGKVAEYRIFYDDFLQPLRACLGDGWAGKIFTIPGNHDVDLSEAENFDREAMCKPEISFFDASEEGKKKRRQVQPRFAAYCAAEKSDSPKNWLSSSAGAFTELEEIGATTLGIIGLNTAWLCKDKDDRHRLTPGISLLEQALEEIEGSDACIVLGHHPIDWFHDEHVESLRALLGEHHAIYLHGHLHRGSGRLEEGSGQSFLAIQAGASFQARDGEKWVNGLLWGELDLRERELLIEPRNWNPRHRDWPPAADAFPTRRRRKSTDQWVFPLPGSRRNELHKNESMPTPEALKAPPVVDDATSGRPLRETPLQEKRSTIEDRGQMFPKRFVRIVAVGTETICGTGYLIDGERVLTAWSVVKAAQTISVQYDDFFMGRAWTEGKTIWHRDGNLDIAVLRIKTDLRIPAQFLRPEPLVRSRVWQSHGWVHARPPANDDNEILTDLPLLKGTVLRAADTARRVMLMVESPPKGMTWWNGVLGAPVFCGGQLRGVIATDPKALAGQRLWAVPVSVLWGAPGFRKAIGYDAAENGQREARKNRLLDDLTDLLRRNRKAAIAIATEKDSWRELLTGAEDFDSQAGVLAEVICISPSWREVLEAFNSAHEKLSQQTGKEAERAAGTIFQIFVRALPEVYKTTSLEVIASGAGGQLITLPVETETLAELAMAAFEGRHLSYEEVETQQGYAVGTALVQPPASKLDWIFNPQSDHAWIKWLDILADSVNLPAAIVQPLVRDMRLADLERLINHTLNRDVDRFREPRRYFTYSSRFAAKNKLFLAKVHMHFPALHLVELAGDTLADEIIECDPLQAILFRSYQTRKRET